MDIKDFIKETLSQIVEGINEANQQMGSKGAFVASTDLWETPRLSKSDTYVKCNNKHQIVREIEFDVSITVSDSSKTEGEGRLQVLSLFRAEGGVENNTHASSMHKIKFSLPLALPSK